MTTPVEGAQSGVEQEDQAQSGLVDSSTSSTEGAQSGATPDKTEQSTERDKELQLQRERARAADQRAAKLEAELRQLKDKDLPEQERKNRQYQETLAANEQLRASLQKERINNAFLTFTGEGKDKYRWRDPAAALKLVDLSDVEVAEDGTVTGLDRALKALADAYPWMLEDKKPAEDDELPAGGAPTMNGSSGTTKPDKGKLVSRFPATRTRMRS